MAVCSFPDFLFPVQRSLVLSIGRFLLFITKFPKGDFSTFGAVFSGRISTGLTFIKAVGYLAVKPAALDVGGFPDHRWLLNCSLNPSQAFSKVCKNTSGGCAPEMAYLSLKTKKGTPLIPIDCAANSSCLTASA